MVKQKSSEPKIVTYLHNKAGKLGLPVGATFEITSRCAMVMSAEKMQIFERKN